MNIWKLINHIENRDFKTLTDLEAKVNKSNKELKIFCDFDVSPL